MKSNILFIIGLLFLIASAQIEHNPLLELMLSLSGTGYLIASLVVQIRDNRSKTRVWLITYSHVTKDNNGFGFGSSTITTTGKHAHLTASATTDFKEKIEARGETNNVIILNITELEGTQHD